MDIRNVDLNLLPVLDALLRHRSVTLAARELDMSQSAVSTALGRLRETLGDQLLVRTGRGMLPTPRASRLAEPVASILDQVRDRLLSASGFVPAESERVFSLCLSDVGSYVLWPRIVSAVAQEAPRVSLRMRTLMQPMIAPALEHAEIDLALGAYPELPVTLYQRRLFERKYVALVRTGHRLAGKRLTIQAFARTPQAVVRLASGIQDSVDAALAVQGLKRDQVLEMPSYLMLPPLLEAGDHLTVIPGQLAEAFSRHGHFVSLKLPFDLPASVIRMHWHRRFHEDAGNVWLRGLITRVFDRV
ncbi:LysR family transcriptional regulator [Hydrogenophaga sp. SL48]|uniref:LysR family transcriptional regulator n=1 Tax=Hydrogenophaga sp. SL48 TaxID=2806347 RepID=UPI001F34712E|nr:LysR family transcriptional regulator [Hydrogenophaga sp. SL48]UJW82012.1 LysR family transcriptional regulator [Hydrogenophaga sp. SL48]